jgi:hypothetical protein
MSYVDGLLANGEHIVVVRRQHWFTLVDMAKWAILALLLAIVVVIVTNVTTATGTLGQLLGLLTLALLVYGLVMLVYAYLRWTTDEFVLTNRRVMQVTGIVNKTSRDSSLEKINDAVLTQSMFGRMFGFGDLDILTASEAGIDRMRMLVDAAGFKRSMIEAKHELELELSRGPMVSPPLRPTPGAPVREETDRVAASPPIQPEPLPASVDTPEPDDRAAAPAPAAVPPDPTLVAAEAVAQGDMRSPTMTADDVTRTLAQLADLRDRGAISTDEFEAKKADLLGRL